MKPESTPPRWRQLFDWALPERYRRRPPLAEAEFVAHLGRLPENDATLRLLLEIVHEQFAFETQQAFAHNLTPEQRAMQTSRAAALYWLLDRIESARAESRERLSREFKVNQPPI